MVTVTYHTFVHDFLVISNIQHSCSVLLSLSTPPIANRKGDIDPVIIVAA